MQLPAPHRTQVALDRLNAASAEDAVSLLASCCGSEVWARRVAAFRPYPAAEALLAQVNNMVLNKNSYQTMRVTFRVRYKSHAYSLRLPMQPFTFTLQSAYHTGPCSAFVSR